MAFAYVLTFEGPVGTSGNLEKSTVLTELPAETQQCQEMRLSDFCSVGSLGHLCSGTLLLVSYTAGKKKHGKTNNLHPGSCV